MKIVLTGGGTGGSITPLLALIPELRKNFSDSRFLWIGGKDKIEQDFAEEYHLPFRSIPCGKIRRYFDPKNITSPFLTIQGGVEAWKILRKFRPDVILGAGGFVSVPVVIAGQLLRIPSLIHQQDIVPGLTNRILAPFATRITVTVPSSLKDFPRRKTVLTGNPIREEIKNGDAEKGRRLFNLKPHLPTLLILGGGTGSLAMNRLVAKALPSLLDFTQVIHVAGKGKNIFQDQALKDLHRPSSLKSVIRDSEDSSIPERSLYRYHVDEFLADELPHAIAAADVVITRAGISTLSELAALGKPIIIIPIPKIHQEKNAQYFLSRDAALVLPQKILTPELLTTVAHDLLKNQPKQRELVRNIQNLLLSDAPPRILREIAAMTKKSYGS